MLQERHMFSIALTNLGKLRTGSEQVPLLVSTQRRDETRQLHTIPERNFECQNYAMFQEKQIHLHFKTC